MQPSPYIISPVTINVQSTNRGTTRLLTKKRWDYQVSVHDFRLCKTLRHCRDQLRYDADRVRTYNASSASDTRGPSHYLCPLLSAWYTADNFRSTLSGENVPCVQGTSIGFALEGVARPISSCAVSSRGILSNIHAQGKTAPSTYYCALFDGERPLFSAPFHNAVFIQQATYADRVGYPSRLRTSHPLRMGLSK